MTKAIKNLAVKQLAYKQTNVFMFRVVLLGIILVASLYIYFVSSVVMSTVVSNQNLGQIRESEQAYSLIETNYMDLIGSFDIEYANQIGLVSQAGETEYIARNTSFARR